MVCCRDRRRRGQERGGCDVADGEQSGVADAARRKTKVAKKRKVSGGRGGALLNGGVA